METVSAKSLTAETREILESLKKKLDKKNVNIIWRVVTFSQPKSHGVYNGLLAAVAYKGVTAENSEVTLVIKNITKLSINQSGWKWKRQAYYEGKFIRDEGIPIILSDQFCFLLTAISNKRIELYCPDLAIRRDDMGILPPAAFSATIDL